MSTRQILLLTIMLTSIFAMKNLDPSKDRTENPKDLIAQLEKTQLDMDDLKDKIYDYIETMPLAGTFSRKEKIGDILKDLYFFETVKTVQINQVMQPAVENKNLDKIFDAEIEGVMEQNNEEAFKGLMVKLRKTLLNSMVRFQYTNLEAHRLLTEEIEKEAQALVTDSLTLDQAKRTVLNRKDIQKRLISLQMSPIMRHLLQKIKIKKDVYSISKNSNKIVLTLQERIQKNQETLNAHIINIKNYNDLRKDPVSNLKNVILQYISSVGQHEFPIDSTNLDLNINRMKNLGDAFSIVSAAKKNNDFVTGVLNMIKNLLDVQTDSDKKTIWKLVGSRLLLQLLVSLGFAKEAFEFSADYFRENNGNVVKSQQYAKILMRNISNLKFEFSPEQDADFKNRVLFMDLVNQVDNDNLPVEIDMEQKKQVINNFEHFFDLSPALRSLNFPAKFTNKLYETIPNAPINLGDNLFQTLLEFRLRQKDSLEDGLSPSLFDSFINAYTDIADLQDLSRFYPVYKLILVLFLENNTTQLQYYTPKRMRDFEVAQELIPNNEELKKIVYALYTQKVPKVKKEFDTVFYLQFLDNKEFDMNNLNWNTPEVEEEITEIKPTKNDKNVKDQIADIIGGFSQQQPKEGEKTKETEINKIEIDEISNEEEPNKKKRRNKNGDTESSEEDLNEDVVVENDGKNLVNVVYGEVDPQLKAHLENSTDLRAYASEIVLEEETEDFIIQTVYVYVQRASSPCFDENL